MFQHIPIIPDNMFAASYPPVTPPGKMGPFYVNTYLLQSDRIKELTVAVADR